MIESRRGMEEKYLEKGFLDIYIYTCNGNCNRRSELRIGVAVRLVRGGTLRKRVKA